MDISADSRYLLIGKEEERLTKRPTTLTSFYRLDLGSMNASSATTPKVETLIEKGEFLNSAQFSPDGKSILVSASPEAFNGIGKNVEEGQTPSMIDTQLYLMTLSDKKVRPLTRDFNPNVQSVEWSKVDGNIYLQPKIKTACISSSSIRNRVSLRFSRLLKSTSRVSRLHLLQQKWLSPVRVHPMPTDSIR